VSFYPALVLILQQRFNRKYYNRKFRTSSISAATTTKPFFLFPDNPPVHARNLFRDKHNDEIKAEASRLRTQDGKASTSHAVYYQQELARRWDGLSDMERARWAEKAEEKVKEIKLNEMDTVFKYVHSISIFLLTHASTRNQRLFPGAMFETLRGMIGSGDNRVGGAAFHLFYGFRNEHDKLDLG
jgi:hypothetical protein